MNLEKICEALSQVDRLGLSVSSGCAFGQLLRAEGTYTYSGYENYEDMQNKAASRVYDMSFDDVAEMVSLNDMNLKESHEDRHTRVLAHYESELVECLIKESSSSSPVEEDSNLCEDASIAPLPMELIST